MSTTEPTDPPTAPPSADQDPLAAAEHDPPAAPPPAPPEGRRSPRRWVLAVGLVVGVLATVGIVQVVRDPGPEEVVEQFFAAILERDVERALSYVGRIGQGVPYGEAAAFLHPDAIADGWELLEVGDAEESRGGNVQVRVEIGDGQDREVGSMELTDYGGEWNLVDPFVTVAISPSPFTYLQVNDRVVTQPYAHNLASPFGAEYKLFPGRYQFFGDLAGTDPGRESTELLLPRYRHGDSVPVAPPLLSPTPAMEAAAQQEMNHLLDDCVEFAVPQPPGCPFATDFFLEYGEGGALESIHDIEWTVVEYPVIRLVDVEGEDRRFGLTVEIEDPGLIRLSATAWDDDPDTAGIQLTDFTADCEVSGEDLYAWLGPDGTPEITVMRSIPVGLGVAFMRTVTGTCEYEPEGGA